MNRPEFVADPEPLNENSRMECIKDLVQAADKKIVDMNILKAIVDVENNMQVAEKVAEGLFSKLII